MDPVLLVENPSTRGFLALSAQRASEYGRLEQTHWQVIDGILHRVQTGVHWRDLPEGLGLWRRFTTKHR
ncbi:transposase [Streptomyces anthocyanicus]|uniref:transposase n=1 Tax=Streptomyces anthocyanicus TaxID=68174 RepID=UPI00336A4F73